MIPAALAADHFLAIAGGDSYSSTVAEVGSRFALAASGQGHALHPARSDRAR